MSYLASSPVTLDGVPLQVKEGGFSVGALQTIDDSQPWLSRSKQAALRGDGDALGFDMATVTGARIRIDYTGESPPPVPANNVLNLDALYAKTLRRTINISGTTMDLADFGAFLGLYDTAQQYWAKRLQFLARIADPDIPYSLVDTEVQAYSDHLTTKTDNNINLVSPLFNGPVMFAEGDSCSFSSYIDSLITDFSFSLAYDTAV